MMAAKKSNKQASKKREIKSSGIINQTILSSVCLQLRGDAWEVVARGGTKRAPSKYCAIDRSVDYSSHNPKEDLLLNRPH